MEQWNRPFVRVVVERHRKAMGAVAFLVTRFPDIFIVPWLLTASDLIIYLIARLVSLLVPIALAGLEVRAMPLLRALSRSSQQLPFQAAAARVNLGYLMICGAVSLAVVEVTPHVAKVFGEADPALKSVLIWLIVGQSAPVFFGATGLLMRVVERGAFYALLRGITAGLFVVGSVIVERIDAVIVAQTFAASQLTLAATCALLLTQCGIWPGLTALFHKEIKLF